MGGLTFVTLAHFLLFLVQLQLQPHSLKFIVGYPEYSSEYSRKSKNKSALDFIL